MSISKRKIRFYTIDFTLYQNSQEIMQNPNNIMQIFLANFNNTNSNNRKMDINNNRFCLLEEDYDFDGQYLSGYFISAKTQHRPPLIDEETLTRRENPKQLTEGEEERTHFVMKIDQSTDEIILLLESRKVGITPLVIAKYIKKFLNNSNIEYRYSIITRDNFIDELENLDQVKVCELFVEKEILGSEALNFSDINEQMQEEVSLTVKAKRYQSIKDKALEIARNVIGGTEQRIRRIKVLGLDNNNNPVTLNTTAAQLDSYVRVNLDEETKIVDTDDILRRMREMLENF
ncbi:hypothetical protein RZR97_08395 [Hydrogenimonas thermophila]|uniref:hypothetical protein n=1 Tax=Hydrogenimonas thermophila TaxID=223786 RepID=UPI00293730F5|nr:hypothetical protein [Hydrogenimonas thermophila]WOE69127.1 hypothetical protein RZR91_08420 [Hydrogenimonas thermophila]WOE71637.1 hypothetical protein RZR97_08395 [Hydrogenimonas thermophila]